MQYKYLIICVLVLIVVAALCFCGYIFLSRNKSEPIVTNLEKELAECEEAIKKNPNDADAYFNKGVLLEDLGEYETAIELYNKALELNHNDFESHVNKGSALYSLKRYELAIDSFNEAISNKN